MEKDLKILISGMRRKISGKLRDGPLDLKKYLEKDNLVIIGYKLPEIDRETDEPRAFIFAELAKYIYYLENGVEWTVYYKESWDVFEIHSHIINGEGESAMRISSLEDIDKLVEWSIRKSSLRNCLKNDPTTKEIKKWFSEKLSIEIDVTVDEIISLRNGIFFSKNHHDSSWSIQKYLNKKVISFRYPNGKTAASFAAVILLDNNGKLYKTKKNGFGKIDRYLAKKNQYK